MSRLHGKPLSECCSAKLVKVPNGEWTEWHCKQCLTNTDAAGKLYRYTTIDPANRSGQTAGPPP